jgi:two-component system phosphate regulon sensor histidine kinase PhoR
MSVALIGLMVIQVYWIKNAITVRQANFTRSVNEAASIVIFRLEKIEMKHHIRKKIDELSMRSRTCHVRDSINRMVLDSLISDELHKKSITTFYEFGVFSSSRNKMVMIRSNSNPETLLEMGYAFTLFPRDMTSKPDYLVIYFPNERIYLISKMWGMLLISIIMIIIIILSFSYTIFTIIRQKKLSEMKNDFINNMTHEFKTPISTISLACQALSDKDIAKSDDIYRNYINIINEENARLSTMAEKILQSAILDRGQEALKKDYFDLHEVIMDVVKKIGIQVEIKDGKIITAFKAKPSIIYADKIHIINIINNILDNANKYSPQKPLINVSTHNDKNGIVISIEDNGIGISKSNQKKIFEKLFRVPAGDVHDFKGFGLGLSYVKAIVDMHGGNIKLESELKKGTKFDVFLPYKSKH